MRPPYPLPRPFPVSYTHLIASQLEPNEWYLRIEGELMADSILNRIATGARYIDLEGPNMREYFAKKKRAD